jgi:hypothetical protein
MRDARRDMRFDDNEVVGGDGEVQSDETSGST